MVKKRILISFILFFVSFLIYLISSNGDTPYNQYTLLANAFIHGKLYVSEIAPWLEKVPIDQNSFFVANPPMPAVLSIPFVLLFSEKFPQQIISFLMGAGIVVSTFLLSFKIKGNLPVAIWSALLAGFGNIVWFLSANGSMWYLAQTTSVFFIMLAINEIYGKKRSFLVGSYLAFSFLTRIQTIVYVPFFVFLLWKNINKKDTIIFSIILLSSLFIFGLYNYLRFGDFFQTGLKLIPGLTNEPWFSEGLFNISYIPDHLKILLTKMPVFSNNFPYIYPTLTGLAIWITSPVFILAFFNKKSVINLVSWLTLVAIAIINLSYGSTGTSQFGYRYAVDFYPLIFLLIIKSINNTGLKWYHWALLIFSILINGWGVLWINKFGWVNF